MGEKSVLGEKTSASHVTGRCQPAKTVWSGSGGDRCGLLDRWHRERTAECGFRCHNSRGESKSWNLAHEVSRRAILQTCAKSSVVAPACEQHRGVRRPRRRCVLCAISIRLVLRCCWAVHSAVRTSELTADKWGASRETAGQGWPVAASSSTDAAFVGRDTIRVPADIKLHPLIR